VCTLKEIFKAKNQNSKDHAAYKDHLQYSYALKEIAEYIILSVSRAIKKLSGKMKNDIKRSDL